MLDKRDRLLIVDDVQPSRQTVINILSILGFDNVKEAADGQEALEILEQDPDIELIISDWKMPRMNGAELLHCVRSSSQWKDLPFIFFTSKGEAEDVAEAAELGVTEYMLKPLNIETVQAKIEAIQSQNPRQQIFAVLKKVKEDCSREDYPQAIQRLKELLLELPSMKARILCEMAWVHFWAGDFQEAEHTVEQSLNHNRLLAKAWHLKSELAKKEEKWENSKNSLDKALQIQPRNVEYYLAKGDTLLYSQEYALARETFQRAINMKPRENWIKSHIWDCYHKHGLCQQAEKNFGTLLTDCLSSDVLNNYAVALRKQGDLERAAELYGQALKKDPDNPTLLYNAAVTDYYYQNWKRAIKRLEKAVADNPGFKQAETFLNKLSKME